jgi:hypothetical protein
VVFEPVRPPAGFRQVQAANLSQWTGNPQHPEFRALVFAVRSLVQIARATAKSAPPAPGELLAPAAEGEPAEAPAPAAPEPAKPGPTVAASVAPPAVASRAEPGPQAAAPARPWVPRLGWGWWLGAAVCMALCVAFIRSPFSYVYCAAPLAASLLAAASRRVDLGEALRARLTLICAVGGALAAVLSAYFLRHKPFEAAAYALFFFGPLAASAIFILATGAVLAAKRLAGPAARPADRPTAETGVSPSPARSTALRQLTSVVFAWPGWLAAAVAMGLCVAVINAADDGDAIEPYFFCAAPVLASLSAALGRRAGLGQVARTAIVWVALGVGAVTLPLVTLLSLQLSTQWKTAASLALGLYFAIGAMSAIFVFGTGGALFARLLRRPRASSGSLR